MAYKSVQVQSVIYENEKKNLFRTIECLANAVRFAREEGSELGQVKLLYGDASPEPVLSQEDLGRLKTDYASCLEIDYRVFGFNSGSAHGHNILAEGCNADYLLIMNPDVRVSPQTLREMMAPFAEEKVGMVEARQTPVEHPKDYNKKTKETDWATTACAMIRNDLFQTLQGFDYETFFLYCDDVDFSWRVRLQGFQVIYQPLAPVFHAKRLDSLGGWQPSHAEIYYSKEASLMMAYKWSRSDLVQQLLCAYRKGSDMEKEIAEKFLKRSQEGTLPKPLDPQHKVSKFVGWNYAKHRFVI